MAKDFKAGQVKTSKIIGKGTEKTVFCRESDSPDGEGVLTGDVTDHAYIGGSDVAFVFTGAPNDKANGVQGVTLFNGDIVVSGTLYAENQVIDLETTTDSGLTISGATPLIAGSGTTEVAIHINTVDEGAIMWDDGDALIYEAGNLLKLESVGGIELNPAAGIVSIGADTRLDAVAGSTQYFNFGDTDGSSGYGIRSNAGAIEFKDKAGAWAGIGSGAGFLAEDEFGGAASVAAGDTFKILGGVGMDTVLTPGTPAGTTEIGINLDYTGTDNFVETAFNAEGTTLSPGDKIIYSDAVTGNVTRGLVSDLPSSGGGSSAGNGLYQISDGAGGFLSVPTVIMGYDSVNKKTTLGIDHLSTGGFARFTVATEASDNVPAVDIVHVTTGGYQSLPALNVIGNTDPATHSPIVSINSRNDKSLIEVTNGFPSGPVKSSNIKFEYSDFSIKNNELGGYVSLEATRPVDPYYTSGDVDAIKCVKGPAANEPTVTILTNPSVPPLSILNSPDINFYVHGVPGTLGVTPTVGKSSANFGGDVKVDGYMSRGGLLQLTKDTPQRIGSPAWNGLTNWDYTNLARGMVTFDAAPIDDNTFYNFVPGNDYVTVAHGGVYRVSYGVWVWHSVNTDSSVDDGTPASSALSHPLTATLGQRSNVVGRLMQDTGSGFSIVDNSFSACYLRFTFITKHLFTATTFVTASAGDKIGVEIAWIGGDNPGGSEFSARDGQTWLTMEKIQ